MRLSRVFIVAFLSLGLTALGAESDSTKTGKEDYYMFPIRPNQINTLAGNMGELRSSHFHAGLDIRTGGRKGLPVYAAADGYVSRVAVKAGGYGKALYITHPSGETTVYAHLDIFKGDIADYVKNTQYKNRNLYLNQYFKSGRFPVSKGDVIALSGNSGSSAGPHLHFEIRDKDQQILNPLKYNFEEIRDTTPPFIKSLSIIPKNINSRISGVFDRINYDLIKSESNYVLEDTIQATGLVGFELYSYDKLDDAYYKCGVSNIKLELDGELVFEQNIDTINFSDQRKILTHYNYPEYMKSGKKYHKLYLDDGNTLPFYNSNVKKGLVNIELGKTYIGKITASDIYGNSSYLEFSIKGAKSNKINEHIPCSSDSIKLINNTLVVLGAPKDEFVDAHYNCNENEYSLYDLSQETQSYGHYTSETTTIPPKYAYQYYGDDVKISFERHALFDTLFLQTSHVTNNESEIFEIGDPSLFVLKSSVNVTLEPDILAPDLSKASVYRVIRERVYVYEGGKWSDFKISFKTRSLGNYTILSDTIPPNISPVAVNANNLKFKISDDLSGIKKFDVFVNNQWVLMDYDYKTSMIWSDLKEGEQLKGDVILSVTDNAGNKQLYKTTIL